MFVKLSYSCDERKLFCELASTCLLAASGFCEERKSAFNVEKTKTVIFNKMEQHSPKNQLKYRGQQIKTVKYFNYLGITLDSNGRFNTAK